MSCPERESLSAFADGELEPAALAEIERHLCNCAACRDFVAEMRGLDSRGRSAVQAISVTARPTILAVHQMRPRPGPIRWLVRTAAAVLLLGVPALVIVYGLKAPGPKQAPVQTTENSWTQEPADTSEPAMPARDVGAGASADAAYERWAAPYRKLHIPLVPMEEMANYRPPEILPTLPVPARPGGKISGGKS